MGGEGFEVSQDKSPLLNSRHDSVDNYLPSPPSDTFKRASIIRLSSHFAECVTSSTLWMLNDAPVPLEQDSESTFGIRNVKQ